MLTRCISGAILAVLALVFMYVGGPALAVVLLLTSLVAYKELTGALKVIKMRRNSVHWKSSA